MKLCESVCKQEKELNEFHLLSKYKDKVYYRKQCKSCYKLIYLDSLKNSQKKYRSSDKYKENRKIKRNTDEQRAKARVYDIKRDATTKRRKQRNDNLMKKLKSDPFFRLKHNMRNRVRNIFRSKKWHKDNKTSQYIGCSLEQLKKHIEDQFSSEMSWENYALVWELDHQKALGLANSKKEIYNLCHYLNLKPMLINDHKNKTKTDKKLIVLQRKSA